MRRRAVKIWMTRAGNGTMLDHALGGEMVPAGKSYGVRFLKLYITHPLDALGIF